MRKTIATIALVLGLAGSALATDAGPDAPPGFMGLPATDEPEALIGYITQICAKPPEPHKTTKACYRQLLNQYEKDALPPA